MLVNRSFLRQGFRIHSPSNLRAFGARVVGARSFCTEGDKEKPGNAKGKEGQKRGPKEDPFENMSFVENQPTFYDLHEKPKIGFLKKEIPAEWVDMEYAAAGFRLDKSFAPSEWDQIRRHKPVDRIPAMVEEHRLRPFYAMSATATKQTVDYAQENKDRLEALWTMSNSHGVSWDDLDAKFMEFAQDGWARELKWQGWETPQDTMSSYFWKDLAMQKAKKIAAKSKRFDIEGNPIPHTDASTRRLARVYYKRWQKTYMEPFNPGELTKHLTDFTTKRMIRRETNDRRFNLAMAKSAGFKKAQAQKAKEVEEDK